MLSAVALAAVALLVAALRWSRIGRQLVAMRDSEAACATFGLNLLWPRIGVFTLSAGIAGLGGALYGMQLGTVSPDRFNLLTGLPIFILVVVGGAGLVGGALFAGFSLFGLIPLTSSLGPLFAKVNTVTPGLTGIGLGRHPSGVVPLISGGVATLRHDPLALGAMGTAMAGAYALRLADVIGNWTFVGLLAAAFVVAGAAAARRARPAEAAEVVVDLDALEWVGVTVPWTPQHLSRVDDALSLDEVARPIRIAVSSPAAVAAATGRRAGPQPEGRRWRRLRSVRSRSASGVSWPSTARRSWPRPVRSPVSSVPTGPARPPCSTPSPGWSRPCRVRSCSTTAT